MHKDAPAWERFLKLDPALVRGLIVTIFALVGAVLKVTILEGTVDDVVTFVLSLSAILTAVLIKPAVTPNDKVVVYNDTPLEEEPTIKAGLSVVRAEDMYAVERAARKAE